MNCTHAQPRLLDHLFDLLDDAEQRELQAHLEGCHASQAELDGAKQQQFVLSLAAKGDFSHVRFEPPAVPIHNPASAPTLALVKPAAPPRRRNFGRWAVAAALLVAVGAGAALVAVPWAQHAGEVAEAERRQRDALAAQKRLEREQLEQQLRAEANLQEIQDQINLLRARWEEQTSKEVEITVTGPEDIQAGAPNSYTIETRRSPRNQPNHLNEQPLNNLQRGPQTPAKLGVQVIDATNNKVLYGPKNFASNGKLDFQLPGDLQVPPGAELMLQVTAENQEGKRVEVTEKLKLTGPLYLTHVATDRPMYRPGDTVRARSLTLQRFNLRPPTQELELRFRLTDGQGKELFNRLGNAKLKLDDKTKDLFKGPDGKILNGYGMDDFPLPADLSEGVYTLTVSEEGNRFPAEKRKFLVRQFQTPRLNKLIEFHRASYGPGEVVQANCTVSRVEGGKPVAGEPVQATVNVDGTAVKVDDADKLRTDPDGQVVLKFRLPEAKELTHGRGSLSVVFNDGKITETTDRPLPIVLNKLLVEFFPEGGDLIVGTANRVYFQVRTTLNKPADLTGKIVDDQGKVVATVQTLRDDKEPGVNQGLGAFSITPKADRKYQLKIDAPKNIDGPHPLPEARTDGVVLNLPQGIIRDTIEVKLHNAGQKRDLFVGAYCRGRLLAQQAVDACPAGVDRAITLRPQTLDGMQIGGVYRITVFEKLAKGELKPLAERLVFRPAQSKLTFNVRTERESYAPGEAVKVSISADDEHKKPKAAVVMLAVVDQSMLKLADEKTYRSLPTHFYLTTEVGRPDDLEHADFLLTDHKLAAATLDLLLGTQGWRRFAEQQPQEEAEKIKQINAPQQEVWTKHKADADRVLFAFANSARQEKPAENAEVQKLAKIIVDKADELHKKQETVVETFQEREQKAAEEQRRLQAEQRAAAQKVSSAAHTLTTHQTQVVRVGGPLAVVGLLLLGVIGLVVGTVRAGRHQHEGRAALVVGFCSFAVLLIGGFAVVVYTAGQQRSNFALESAMNAPGRVDKDRGGDKGRDKDGGKGAEKWQEKLGRPAPLVIDDMNPADKENDAKANFFNERMKDVVIPGIKNPKEPLVILGDEKAEKKANKGIPEPVAKDKVKEDGEQRGVNGFEIAPQKIRLAGKFAREKPAVVGFDLPPRLEQLQERFGMDRLRAKKNLDDLALDGGWLELPEKERQAVVRRLMKIDPDRAAQLVALTYKPWVVRQYAHQHAATPDGTRADFTDTVCWQPVLVLPAGKPAEVKFDLNDSVTRFQVLVAGHSPDGRLGVAMTEFASKLPFSIHPKLPAEIGSADKLTIPLTLANDTDQPRQVEVSVKSDHLKVTGDAKVTSQLAALKRSRTLFDLEPGVVEGTATLRFLGRCDPFGSDAIEKKVRIVPDGFPYEKAVSDILQDNATQTLTLPARREHWVAGTLRVQAQVFPSTLADLQQGLEGMLREPYGCFEQTSSSNYPNVLILSYLKDNGQVNPAVEKRAHDLLTRGLARLTGFECNNQQGNPPKWGFEWFGGNAPPHEALTAYGLLQFQDMTKVHPVDAEMMARTRQFLLSKRDDDSGGFKQRQGGFDGFGGAPADLSNAYVLWALTEAGAAGDLKRQLDWHQTAAQKSKDSYFVALVSLSLLNAGRTDEAVALLRTLKLAQDQAKDGHVGGAATSITRSAGQNLQLETTALTMLGWMQAKRPGDFQPAIEKAVKWIGKQRNGGGSFGTTQATVLTLKALIAHARESKRTAKAGELKLYVGEAAEPVAVQKFVAGQQGAITIQLADAERLLKPGDNKVRLELTGGNVLPYTVTVAYRAVTPVSNPDAALALTTKLDKNAAKEGDTVRLTVNLKSVKQADGMAVAVIGLPAGLMLPDNLEELNKLKSLRNKDTEPGDIDHYEIRGRELILYWRQAPAERTVQLSLICQNPGTFRGPASRAYLYYQPERKTWVEPLNMTIGQ